MNGRGAWFLIGIGVCLLAAAQSGRPAPASTTCSLEIELFDARTDETLPGIVQVLNAKGQGVELESLVSRGQGIEKPGPIHDWWVLPQRSTLEVPAAPLVIKALSGLETELASKSIDLSGKTSFKLRLPLVRFYEARANGYLAGNTHLHLMKLSKQEADRYLREVPLADGLDVVFLSYLERTTADLDYTSNKYTAEQLKRMSHGRLHFGHGQEHRHNFGSHGEGYGHILLLDIPYIIHPVSIGPGITRQSADSPALQEGIDKTRKAGGKVVWAHNMFGLEDIPNWVTGRVHANNIFDGSERGSFKDTYYRYLNIGLSVPFSTGTDWFIYDFSRVYVMSQQTISPTAWLDLLAAGRSSITNGPLLEFTVDGQPLGSVLEWSKPGAATIHGRAMGRSDFKRIELIRGGQVVGTATSRAERGHYVAEMDIRLALDAPAWLALRTPPPPVPDDPELQEPVGQNELGGRIFAHTSPIYVRLSGQGVFDAKTAAGLVDEMKAALEKIQSQATFDDPLQRKRVTHVYEEAINLLEKRLGR